MKTALITGITGQDGSYLAELLLNKGYNVHGIIRRSSSINTRRLDSIYDNPGLSLHYGDVTDGGHTLELVLKLAPDEIYNLAGQSHVRASFEMPAYTTQTISLSTIHLLDAIKGTDTRFYQASSSEMFGGIHDIYQYELTPFYPRSPYAVAKAAAHYTTINYREAYGLHASCGILFNHESPRRGETFVTRKITRAIAKILTGKQDKLFLGNLDAKRDWGYAPDYVEAMWMMLQKDKPDDYVIATGETHTVREFLEEAFSLVDLDWQKYVQIDPKYFRPTEVNFLCGDATKARNILGWKPKTAFKQLVRIMVDADLKEESIKDDRSSEAYARYCKRTHRD